MFQTDLKKNRNEISNRNRKFEFTKKIKNYGK